MRFFEARCYFDPPTYLYKKGGRRVGNLHWKGSPQSLLSVTRVSVVFNYPKSQRGNTVGWENEIADIFFFLSTVKASSMDSVVSRRYLITSVTWGGEGGTSQVGLLRVRDSGLESCLRARSSRSAPHQSFVATKSSPCRAIPHKDVRLKATTRSSRRAPRTRPTVLRWGPQWVPVTERLRIRPTWPDIAGTRNTRPLDRDEAPRTSSRLCRKVPPDRLTDELVDDRTTVLIRVRFSPFVGCQETCREIDIVLSAASVICLNKSSIYKDITCRALR